MFKKLLNRSFQDKFTFQDKFFLFLLLTTGVASWSLTMIKSGLTYTYGMGFWGANGHDGVWHIALAKSLAKGSFEIPIFSGELLSNYHVGFDLLLALIYKLTSLPMERIYFQIIPPILAISLGILVYVFVKNWSKSKEAALWSTFFVYFAGSLGWIVTYARDQKFGGESMFWSQQAVSTLINPPFALSLIIILAGLVVIAKIQKKWSWKYFILASFLFGILFQIKAYAGILSLTGLFACSLVYIFRDKNYNFFKVFLGSFFVFAITFLPFMRGTEDFLIFKPFWFLETMMGLSDRFYWPRFYEAMVNYKLGNVWIKTIPAYFVAFVVFWYGNMGTRFLGEFSLAKWIVNLKKTTFIEIFLLIGGLWGLLFALLFVQKGTPWNTIQFFYYTLFFLSIISGVFLGKLLEKKNNFAKYFISFLVIILTIPTSLSTLYYHYLPSRPPAKISHEELEALRFLSKMPDGVVLTYPYDEYQARKAEVNPPRPLYLYESTAYVSAFSGKSVYLEDQVNLDITGYDWRGRREEVLEFLKSNDQEFVRRFLSENNISYIYWIKGQRAVLGETQLGLKRVFENKLVDIYKVTRQ